MVKTLRPQNYNDVIFVGHYFCEGFALVMDLTSLTDVDAMPLVDFAAGLIVGRGGTMERVAPKVFLLRPRGVARPDVPSYPVTAPAWG